MIRKAAAMPLIEREALRSGIGCAKTQNCFTEEELAPHAGMVARITLAPGCSIGEHAHTEDAELYYLLSGMAMANDNGEMVELHAGDAMWTSGGAHHAIINHGTEPLVLLAVVAK